MFPLYFGSLPLSFTGLWARFARCPARVSVHSSRSPVKRESIWNIGRAAAAKFRIWLPLALGGLAVLAWRRSSWDGRLPIGSHRMSCGDTPERSLAKVCSGQV